MIARSHMKLPNGFYITLPLAIWTEYRDESEARRAASWKLISALPGEGDAGWRSRIEAECLRLIAARDLATLALLGESLIGLPLSRKAGVPGMAAARNAAVYARARLSDKMRDKAIQERDRGIAEQNKRRERAHRNHSMAAKRVHARNRMKQIDMLLSGVPHE